MAEVMKWIVSVILLNRHLEIKQELKKYSKQNEIRPIWLILYYTDKAKGE